MKSCCNEKLIRGVKGVELPISVFPVKYVAKLECLSEHKVTDLCAHLENLAKALHTISKKLVMIFTGKRMDVFGTGLCF